MNYVEAEPIGSASFLLYEGCRGFERNNTVKSSRFMDEESNSLFLTPSRPSTHFIRSGRAQNSRNNYFLEIVLHTYSIKEFAENSI